jgi:very-short-patch-repair endonuclease
MTRRPGDAPAHPRVGLPGVRLARDHTTSSLQRAQRSGELVRVTRGAYLPTVPPSVPPGGRARPAATTSDRSRERDVALARVVGVHDRLRAPHWFVRESAALVWGLALWVPPATTHVMQPYKAGTRHDPAVSHHLGRLVEGEQATVLGLPVTALERTVVDCAATLPPIRALVVADAGLRAGADPELMRDVLSARAGRRGVRRARAVVELADVGAESPGETAARFVVLRDGLPLPTTQVRVETSEGTFWSDLGWPEWKVLLEYDGGVKYAVDARGAFMQEKRRHDAIQEAGWRVLRVVKGDLRGSTLTRRVLAAAPPSARSALCRRPELSD